MKPLNSDQTIWLARGVALGSFLRRLLRTLRRGVGQLRAIGLAGTRLPKRP